jgi:hypothetical protein
MLATAVAWTLQQRGALTTALLVALTLKYNLFKKFTYIE